MPKNPMYTSDATERELRVRWHEAKAALAEVGFPDTGPQRHAFNHADKLLSDYIWQRASDDIEADRRRHPKAKRNQGLTPNPDKTRMLP